MTTPELEDTRAAETFDWLCLVSKPPTEAPQAGPFYQGRRDGWIAALRGVTGPVTALRAALTAAQAEAERAREQVAVDRVLGSRELDVLRNVVVEARNRWSRVDNGYCSICGRHRLHHDSPAIGGGLRALPSLCENADCFSHAMDSALRADDRAQSAELRGALAEAVTAARAEGVAEGIVLGRHGRDLGGASIPSAEEAAAASRRIAARVVRGMSDSGVHALQYELVATSDYDCFRLALARAVEGETHG